MTEKVHNLQAIKDLIANAPKRSVLIGDTLHVFVGEDTKGQVDAQIKRALARGDTVTENGVAQWQEWWAVMNPGKTGSEAYTWIDGNRVRCELFHFVKDKNGHVTKTSIRKCWRPAASVL